MSTEVAEQPKELEVKLENLSIKDEKPTKDNTDECVSSNNDDGHQSDESDDDSRKLFVGGLSWETSENDLREYFSQWGKVTQSIIKIDRVTGCSRGFGFVTMESEDCVSKVLDIHEHKLKGKKIDPKKAKPSREPLKKIFVGGIDPDVTQDQIIEYFSQFGKIDSMDLPYDTARSKRKNYIFICFHTGTAAKRAISKERQEIFGKICDVRIAVSREQANRQKILKNFYGSWNDQLYGYNGGYSYPDFMSSFNIDPYALYLGYDLYGNNNPNAATVAVQNAFAQYRNASTARVLPSNPTPNGPHSQQGPGAINPYSRANHTGTPNANPTVASMAAAAAANFANRFISVQQQTAMHHPHHPQQTPPHPPQQHHNHHSNSNVVPPSSQQQKNQSQPPPPQHYMHNPHLLMNGNSAPDANNAVRGVLKDHEFRYTPEPFNSP